MAVFFLPQANTPLTIPGLLKHSPPVAAGLAPRHAPRPLRNVCTAALSASSPDEPAEPAVHAGQQEGSAEQFLLNECGIEASKVDGIITAAVAWRVTPGGRQLIDRRRRSRIERNMLQCAEYLIKECGIEPGQTLTVLFALSHGKNLLYVGYRDAWIIPTSPFLKHT